MPAPNEIVNLVDRFRRNLDDYHSARYNELQLRTEFLDPFFKALGWDVNNERGYGEDYKDVVHEDSIKIGGSTKAPDYCFRAAGLRKFFVEAKRPAVNIREDGGPAYQLRRYAWSAKLSVSILTNFEEFLVYDCRVRPAPRDKPAVARITSFRYSDYLTKWDQIAEVFSRDAVWKGSFDRYGASKKEKKGTAEVDSEFLKEIESWRDMLARNIALRNPVTQPQLNFSVQRIIDRIIFLRICEDRGMEHYGQLQTLLNGQQVYDRLGDLSRKADYKYNSGLFHFDVEKGRAEPPDNLTLGLTVDDRPLKDIISSLYYPDSPYEFCVLPADILGQVYEQFLGKVIRLTPAHQARVEEKPEVKKAGGVYYTPTHVVEYIVKATVRKALDGKAPKDASRLRLIDPACGSGSFLLVAYQELLDWHRKWYGEDGPDRHPRALYRTAAGDWRLTIEERKRVLLNSIYGVDVDPQAVEVTKLSLLLKVLEGETDQTLHSQYRLFHKQRALPDLGRNIKCGNSLIGPDIYADRLLGDEERLTINAFDWHREFAVVMRAGGFDVVIGNPPYLFITELDALEKDYFSKVYSTCEYRFDVYGLFAELAVRKLLRPAGVVSFITPHTLLSNDSFEKLRRLLLQECALEQVLDIGPGVFRNAKNETMIFVARKRNGRPKRQDRCRVVLTTAKEFGTPVREFDIDQREWLKNRNAAWLVRVSTEESTVLAKMEAAPHRVGDFCTVNQGLRTGNNEKYLSDKPASKIWKPAGGGKQVGRYQPLKGGLFVYYNPDVLDAPRRREIFESPEKIVVQEIRNITLPRRIVATYDTQQFFCLQSTNVINLRDVSRGHIDLRFLLGILNSRPANFYFRQRFPGNNHIASNQLAQIPVPDASPELHQAIVETVQLLLDLHCKLTHRLAPHETVQLNRQIDTADERVDQLVYELYGLSKDEVAVVEREPS